MAKDDQFASYIAGVAIGLALPLVLKEVLRDRDRLGARPERSLPPFGSRQSLTDRHYYNGEIIDVEWEDVDEVEDPQPIPPRKMITR